MRLPFEVLEEGETQVGVLNRSVRWRVERRFGEPIICSTFIATRSELELQIGTESLPPNADEAIITIENYISNKWKRIRRKTTSDPADLDESPESPLIIIGRVHKERCQFIPAIAIGPSEDFLVLDQDIDSTHSPLGRPVHWHIERRGNEDIYCSTFTAMSQEIRNFYGAAVDSILDSRPKMTITIETYPSDSWQKIRTPVLDPRTEKVCSLESGLGQWERRLAEAVHQHRNPWCESKHETRRG